MSRTKELREKRANAWAQAQEFNERHKKGEEMSPEDQASWDRALGEVDSLKLEIDNAERSDALDKEFEEIDEDTVVVNPDGDPNGSRDQYRDVFRRWCAYGAQDLTLEERQLLQANFVAHAGPDGARTQTTVAGAAGGYTVPEGFWAKVTETQKYYGGAAVGAEVITTDTGNGLPWATNDDTAVMGYQLGEGQTATNEGDLVFGKNALAAWTFVSGPVKASLQLIQDTGIDMEAFVAKKMGARLGRIENLKLTAGAGGTTPQGYMTGITTGRTTDGATAITYDELIDLIHSVDAAYRASGRCQFKLHDLVLAKLRKIRDDSGGAGLGRPIWEPSVKEGQPDTLLGYGLTVNNDMDSTVTATKKTVAFGDFEAGFVVRRVKGGQMTRLAERYADELAVGFIGYERVDSLVQDPSAVKALVQHA